MTILADISEAIETGLAAFRKNRRDRSRTGPVHDRAMYHQIGGQRKAGDPTHVAFCESCRIYHPIHSDHDAHLRNAVEDFKEKHRDHWVRVHSVPVWTREGWRPNADVKEAFQSEQTATTTNLQSKASSTTAGWTGNTVDNTSNLYLDADVHVVIAAVNTAPANHKAVYVYAFAGTNSTDVTVTGAASGGTPGTEGSLTFPAVDTLTSCLPTLMIIPYPVQNAAIHGHASLSKVYSLLPAFWGVAALNYAGFTLAASGNTVLYRGAYSTVV
jgi:hypothetical protein